MRSWFLPLALAACGGNTPVVQPLPDARPPDASAIVECNCNPLAQTGCESGEKCTWITDQVNPPLGHIACPPDGTVPIGGACALGPITTTTGPCAMTARWDDCERGAICSNGVCEAICDPYGGSPKCETGYACALHPGVFQYGMQQPFGAGDCEPTCDPLADNDFLGSGTKAGNACAAGSGCYGLPDDTAATFWRCDAPLTMLVHRSACTTANGCADANGSPYINGCAQGYIPLMYDSTGSMQVDCIAVCAPADCYAGHCGASSANLGGAAPHTCTPADARGTFNVASATNNGDQCMYSWLFEIDTTGHFFRSPTSDTVGFCIDHSKYQYDSNGDGTVGGSDAAWPPCDSFTHTGLGTRTAVGGVCNDANGCIGAADFGCVSTATAGVMFTGKPRLAPELRLPFVRPLR